MLINSSGGVPTGDDDGSLINLIQLMKLMKHDASSTHSAHSAHEAGSAAPAPMMHGDAVRCRRWIKRSSRRVSASDMDPLFSSRIIHSDIFVRRIRLDSTRLDSIRPGQLSGDLRIRSCQRREEQRISVRCAPPHGNDSEIISTHIWE